MITLSNGKVTLETVEGKIEFTPDKDLKTIHVHAEVDTATGKIVTYSLSPGTQKETIEAPGKDSAKPKDVESKKGPEETANKNDSSAATS